MPQVQCIAPSRPGTELELSEIVDGRFIVDDRACRVETEGSCLGQIKAVVANIVPALRKRPEGPGNRDFGRVPLEVTCRIFDYLADPFERASLATVCRVIYQRLGPYRPEFALFRNLIAAKKNIEYESQSSFRRNLTVWLDLFTGDSWSSGRRLSALRKTFARLNAMYPHIPERVFHEVFPLFTYLKPGSHVQVLEELVHRAMDRSPHLAVTVLTEFACRMIYDPKVAAIYDKLLELAIPLWRDERTAKEADRLIGCIARRMHSDTRARDKARWTRILNLLPPSVEPDSLTTVGMAIAAGLIDGRHRSVDHPESAQGMLIRRLGYMPSQATMASLCIRLMPEGEEGIDVRRNHRYATSPKGIKEAAQLDADIAARIAASTLPKVREIYALGN